MPIPSVKQTDPPLTNEEAREKVGDFVRRALPLHRRLAATGWPTEVGWDDMEIWATARRGELVLRTERRHLWWWSPAARRHALELADSLARVLYRTIEGQYQGIDETGRVHVTLWRRPDGLYVMEEGPGLVPERYVLDVGWYAFMPNTARWANLSRFGSPACLEVPEALERGIMRREEA